MDIRHFFHSAARVLLMCALWCAASAAAGEFAVIVNAANTYKAPDAEARQTVKRIFLKELSKWPDGPSAKPVDRDDESAARQALLRSVIGISAAQWASHWLDLKQKTGQTPPRQVRSDEMVFKLIQADPGAVSVADKGAVGALPPGVKVLFTFTSD